MADLSKKNSQNGGPEAAAGPKPKGDFEPLCAMCGEVSSSQSCPSGHWICDPCLAVYLRAHELLACSTPVCPILDCLSPPLARPDEAAAPPVRTARLVRLAKDCPGFGKVAKAFGLTLSAAKIESLFRVENSALRGVYLACKERMQKEGRLMGTTKEKNVGANEQWLFHATTRAASGSIVREGFDASRAGESHGTALGSGIYLTPDASFAHRYSSPDARGECVMFYCQALLGDTSGRDSKSGPSQFVVKREQQIFPAYRVHYSAQQGKK